MAAFFDIMVQVLMSLVLLVLWLFIAAAAGGNGLITKLGKAAEGLDFAPYPGELGKRIWENVSKEAWAAWLKHQTMLVNENRLNLADARARQYLARQMENHFFGDGADAAQGYVPPSA